MPPMLFHLMRLRVDLCPSRLLPGMCVLVDYSSCMMVVFSSCDSTFINLISSVKKSFPSSFPFLS